jgi:hypothetical protein
MESHNDEFESRTDEILDRIQTEVQWIAHASTIALIVSLVSAALVVALLAS